MSFRLFVYYCAICGAWAAFLGWVLGRLIAPQGEGYGRALTQGAFLGLLVAGAGGLVDGWWNRSGRGASGVALQTAVAVAVGCFGGLFGAAIGQTLVMILERAVAELSGLWALVEAAFVVFGWTITGLAVGASAGVYDVLLAIVQRKDLRGALRKLGHGVLGGTIGGFAGSAVYTLLNLAAGGGWLLPSAVGFVALGLAIGLLIGLAQVILKEAWLRVEAGFRPGRELILAKAETTIGRAESCDVGLFGDSGVERTHARILFQDNRYVLADTGTAGGTFVNDERLVSPRPLRSGDVIRVGGSVLRFGERQKRK